MFTVGIKCFTIILKYYFHLLWKQSICYGYGLVFWTDKHGSSGLCGSQKDKSFWKQTGITHFTSRASIHRDHIPQSRFSQHTHTKPQECQTGWILDDDRVTDRNRSWHLLLCDVWHRMWDLCKERDHGDSMSIWHIQRSKNLRPLLVFETWEKNKAEIFQILFHLCD